MELSNLPEFLGLTGTAWGYPSFLKASSSSHVRASWSSGSHSLAVLWEGRNLSQCSVSMP